MRCLPFGEPLYRTLQQEGLDAETLWKNRARFGRGRRWPANPDGLEDELRWLITVGVLRREVDGRDEGWRNKLGVRVPPIFSPPTTLRARGQSWCTFYG